MTVERIDPDQRSSYSSQPFRLKSVGHGLFMDIVCSQETPPEVTSGGTAWECVGSYALDGKFWSHRYEMKL